MPMVWQKKRQSVYGGKRRAGHHGICGSRNKEIFSRLMSDEEFRKMASEHLLHKVYKSINHAKD